MNNSTYRSRHTLFHRILSAFIAFNFTFSLILPPGYAQLIPQTLLNLPAPGTMVTTSAAFTPTLIKGLTIHPENPLEFDFIVEKGQNPLEGEEFNKESMKLVKYFLASLTVPEDQMWVNLSPYEKNRTISDKLGETEMGRDMLAQDYILKQLMASLLYPENELGERFWDRVYTKAREQYGTTEIPMDTFNKVWIVPDKAVVYEHEGSVYVIESHLKVMLEEDYEVMNFNAGNADLRSVPGQNGVSTEIIREIIIPEIEKEVNEGENFANLRQIYNSMILATWYKKNLRESLLGRVYVDKSKTRGVDLKDPQVNQKIYAQYLEAFKKGVYNYIKEDVDPATKEVIPRKYFSGGAVGWKESNLTTLYSLPVAQQRAIINTFKNIGDTPGKRFEKLKIKLYEIAAKNQIAEETMTEIVKGIEDLSDNGAQEFFAASFPSAANVWTKPLDPQAVMDKKVELTLRAIALTEDPDLGAEDIQLAQKLFRDVDGFSGLLHGLLPSRALKKNPYSEDYVQQKLREAAVQFAASEKAIETLERQVASSPVAKVLLVDDYSNLLSARKKQLERNGYIVTTAKDGVEAFEAFQDDSFDLVLTDYEMPNLDGPGLISKIREYEKINSKQSIPVLMVSADISEEKILKAGNLKVPLYSKIKGKGELRNIATTVEETLKQEPLIKELKELMKGYNPNWKVYAGFLDVFVAAIGTKLDTIPGGTEDMLKILRELIKRPVYDIRLMSYGDLLMAITHAVERDTRGPSSFKKLAELLLTRLETADNDFREEFLNFVFGHEQSASMTSIIDEANRAESSSPMIDWVDFRGFIHDKLKPENYTPLVRDSIALLAESFSRQQYPSWDNFRFTLNLFQDTLRTMEGALPTKYQDIFTEATEISKHEGPFGKEQHDNVVAMLGALSQSRGQKEIGLAQLREIQQLFVKLAREYYAQQTAPLPAIAGGSVPETPASSPILTPAQYADRVARKLNVPFDRVALSIKSLLWGSLEKIQDDLREFTAQTGVDSEELGTMVREGLERFGTQFTGNELLAKIQDFLATERIRSDFISADGIVEEINLSMFRIMDSEEGHHAIAAALVSQFQFDEKYVTRALANVRSFSLPASSPVTRQDLLSSIKTIEKLAIYKEKMMSAEEAIRGYFLSLVDKARTVGHGGLKPLSWQADDMLKDAGPVAAALLRDGQVGGLSVDDKKLIRKTVAAFISTSRAYLKTPAGQKTASSPMEGSIEAMARETQVFLTTTRWDARLMVYVDWIERPFSTSKELWPTPLSVSMDGNVLVVENAGKSTTGKPILKRKVSPQDPIQMLSQFKEAVTGTKHTSSMRYYVLSADAIRLLDEKIAELTRKIYSDPSVITMEGAREVLLTAIEDLWKLLESYKEKTLNPLRGELEFRDAYLNLLNPLAPTLREYQFTANLEGADAGLEYLDRSARDILLPAAKTLLDHFNILQKVGGLKPGEKNKILQDITMFAKNAQTFRDILAKRSVFSPMEFRYTIREGYVYALRFDPTGKYEKGTVLNEFYDQQGKSSEKVLVKSDPEDPSIKGKTETRVYHPNGKLMRIQYAQGNIIPKVKKEYRETILDNLEGAIADFYGPPSGGIGESTSLKRLGIKPAEDIAFKLMLVTTFAPEGNVPEHWKLSQEELSSMTAIKDVVDTVLKKKEMDMSSSPMTEYQIINKGLSAMVATLPDEKDKKLEIVYPKILDGKVRAMQVAKISVADQPQVLSYKIKTAAGTDILYPDYIYLFDEKGNMYERSTRPYYPKDRENYLFSIENRNGDLIIWNINSEAPLPYRVASSPMKVSLGPADGDGSDGSLKAFTKKQLEDQILYRPEDRNAIMAFVGVIDDQDFNERFQIEDLYVILRYILHDLSPEAYYDQEELREAVREALPAGVTPKHEQVVEVLFENFLAHQVDHAEMLGNFVNIMEAYLKNPSSSPVTAEKAGSEFVEQIDKVRPYFGPGSLPGIPRKGYSGKEARAILSFWEAMSDLNTEVVRYLDDFKDYPAELLSGFVDFGVGERAISNTLGVLVAIDDIKELRNIPGIESLAALKEVLNEFLDSVHQLMDIISKDRKSARYHPMFLPVTFNDSTDGVTPGRKRISGINASFIVDFAHDQISVKRRDPSSRDVFNIDVFKISVGSLEGRSLHKAISNIAYRILTEANENSSDKQIAALAQEAIDNLTDPERATRPGVLIIDNKGTMAEHLPSSDKYDVTVVANREEAWGVLQREDSRVGVVVIDSDMDLVGQMQEQDSDIYIVMTGNDLKRLKETWRRYGFRNSVDFLGKEQMAYDLPESVEWGLKVFRGEVSSPLESTTKGGIDLNPALLDLQIKRDGNGVPLPLPQQPIKDMHIEGFLPVIINVTPITNLPLLLGIADEETPSNAADSGSQPLELGFAVKEN